MLRANPHYLVTIVSSADSPGATPVHVSAPMPESFMYDAASQYEAPFTQGLTGNSMIDTVLRVGTQTKLVTQTLTAQIWQGSTETELGLELEFQAEVDPATEVRDPIKNLMKLVTPSTDHGGFITSPGPKLDSQILKDFVAAAERAGSAAGSVVGVGDYKGNVNVGTMMNAEVNNAQGSGGLARTNDGADTIGTVDYIKGRVRDKITIRIGNYAYFDSVVITNVQKTYESQLDARTGLAHYAKVGIRFKPLFMIVQADLDQIFSPPPTSGIPDRGSGNTVAGAIGGLFSSMIGR